MVKTHFLVNGYAICNSPIREFGRLGTPLIAEFAALKADERCIKCSKLLQRMGKLTR